jgi:hypothetical protein
MARSGQLSATGRCLLSEQEVMSLASRGHC